MDEHGLQSWTFKFDRARTRAGQCVYGPRVISLSTWLLERRSYDESLNTITHEIAHALVGVRHDHDLVWRKQHIALGGDGARCFQFNSYADAPWIGTCAHGKESGMFRRPKNLHGWRCKCPQGSSPVVWENRR
jgi:hypothetical protein